MTDVVDAPTGRWSAIPRWVRIALLLFAAAIVALLVIVAVRLVTRVPPIPLGTTSAADLRPGSCLAESARDLDEYTVVDCGEEHPQQVFGAAELEFDESVYALVETAMDAFADEVCDGYLQYRLFLREGLPVGEYEAYAIDVPAPAEYEAGDTEALCAVAADDGSDLTEDLYRPMP